MGQSCKRSAPMPAAAPPSVFQNIITNLKRQLERCKLLSGKTCDRQPLPPKALPPKPPRLKVEVEKLREDLRVARRHLTNAKAALLLKESELTSALSEHERKSKALRRSVEESQKALQEERNECKEDIADAREVLLETEKRHAFQVEELNVTLEAEAIRHKEDTERYQKRLQEALTENTSHQQTMKRLENELRELRSKANAREKEWEAKLREAERGRLGRGPMPADLGSDLSDLFHHQLEQQEAIRRSHDKLLEAKRALAPGRSNQAV